MLYPAWIGLMEMCCTQLEINFSYIIQWMDSATNFQLWSFSTHLKYNISPWQLKERPEIKYHSPWLIWWRKIKSSHGSMCRSIWWSRSPSGRGSWASARCSGRSAATSSGIGAPARPRLGCSSASPRRFLDMLSQDGNYYFDSLIISVFIIFS